MKIPKEAKKVSRELFQASFKNGLLDHANIRAIAAKVVERKPRHYTDILSNFERLIRLEMAKRHATIESASALDDSTREQLESSLRAKYGADLTTEFKVTPELIGGLRVKIGSDVFDGSVKERLRQLEESLAA